MLIIVGAWSPRVNDKSQWIQADLGNKHYITGVITQGRLISSHNQRVTSFEVWNKPSIVLCVIL